MEKLQLEEKRASIFYKLGVTKSMGNFESVRIDFGVTIPCREDQIRIMTKKAIAYVEKVIEKELDKYAK